MLGTIVNTVCIMIGSTVGSVAKRAIKPQYQSALYHAMGLAALVLGINAVTSHLPESNYPVSSIVSCSISLNPSWQKDSRRVFYYIVLEPCRWSALS